MSDMTPVSPADEAGSQAPPEYVTGPVANRQARRILGVVLLVLVLLLGASAYFLYRAARVPTATTSDGKPIETRGVQWVRSIYGTSNRPQDLFGQTQAAVPDSEGTIWVTDTLRKSSLMRFRPDGSYIGKFQSSDASSPIKSPSRFAVDKDGYVYVCETALDRIHVLGPDGQEVGSFNVPQPVSVALGEDRIAVGAVSGFAVTDMSGKPIMVFGSRGKGDDQFDYVHGIAFGPDGSIYVSDSYNNRLSAYESNGKRRWIIRTGAPANSAQMSNDMLMPKETTDTVLTGADALQLPLGLTIDGAGRVVVVDMFDCSLAVFDPKTGKFIGKYGEVGAEDGQFFYPVSVGYDAERDWFTIADGLNRRVEIVRIPGSQAGGGGAVAAVRRAVAGPWRACCFPLLLLIVIAVILVLNEVRRRRAVRSDTGETQATASA